MHGICTGWCLLEANPLGRVRGRRPQRCELGRGGDHASAPQQGPHLVCRHRAAVQRVCHSEGLSQPRVHMARLCSRRRRTPRQHRGAALGRSGGLGLGQAEAGVGRLLAHECLVHQRAELRLIESTGLGYIGLQRGARRVAAWDTQGCSLHYVAAHLCGDGDQPCDGRLLSIDAEHLEGMRQLGGC